MEWLLLKRALKARLEDFSSLSGLSIFYFTQEWQLTNDEMSVSQWVFAMSQSWAQEINHIFRGSTSSRHIIRSFIHSKLFKNNANICNSLAAVVPELVAFGWAKGQLDLYSRSVGSFLAILIELSARSDGIDQLAPFTSTRASSHLYRALAVFTWRDYLLISILYASKNQYLISSRFLLFIN